MCQVPLTSVIEYDYWKVEFGGNPLLCLHATPESREVLQSTGLTGAVTEKTPRYHDLGKALTTGS